MINISNTAEHTSDPDHKIKKTKLEEDLEYIRKSDSYKQDLSVVSHWDIINSNHM